MFFRPEDELSIAEEKTILYNEEIMFLNSKYTDDLESNCGQNDK